MHGSGRWLLAVVFLTSCVGNGPAQKFDEEDEEALSSGSTMIAEIPYPGCLTGSSWNTQVNASRSAFDARYAVTTSFQTANEVVSLTGVGFFDVLHGQTGVAPNGIELHSVLSICWGTN